MLFDLTIEGEEISCLSIQPLREEGKFWGWRLVCINESILLLVDRERQNMFKRTLAFPGGDEAGEGILPPSAVTETPDGWVAWIGEDAAVPVTPPCRLLAHTPEEAKLVQGHLAESPFMSPEEAARFAKISRSTLDSWRRDGLVTALKQGGVVLYHRERLEKELLALFPEN